MRSKTVSLLVIAGLLLTSFPVHSNPSRRDENRRSGAQRSGCSNFAKDASRDELIALVPEKVEMKVASVTPSFWFYNPYTSNSSLSARFLLRDENEQLVGEPVTITLPKVPGILRVQFPQPLKQNSLYRWYLSIECDAARPAKNPHVDGWVNVIGTENKLSSSLERSLTPVQTAAIYHQAGFWSDALTILGKHQEASVEVKTAWSELLKAEKLDEVASKPILPCCSSR